MDKTKNSQYLPYISQLIALKSFLHDKREFANRTGKEDSISEKALHNIFCIEDILLDLSEKIAESVKKSEEPGSCTS